jgi:DNA-binding NarL/FixJ family response regulator
MMACRGRKQAAGIRGEGYCVASLRILVADDHDLMRRGIRDLLEAHPGWEVCAEARTGSEAVARAEELRPDIVVLDFRMPGLNGLDAARKILQNCPGTETLILSVDRSEQLIREVVAAGVHGYVLKADSDRDLIAAVEALQTHRPFFTSCAAELLLNLRSTLGQAADVRRETLTSRERELVRLIAEGHSTAEAAGILGISPKTADTHRSNLMRKLGIHSVSELVRYAIRNQVIAG